jgi:hypothetical protein
MQALIRIRQTVRTWLKHPRARFVAGGVVLFLVSCAVLVLALSGALRKGGKVDAGGITVPSSTALRVARRLDGMPALVGEEALVPFAVMIENHPDARPLSGVAKASIVIEAPVEGGITRLFALYDATTTVEQVGPVRSARPYYVDWAYGWNALYVHVGGSPDALTKINALGDSFRDLNEFFAGRSFWRSGARSAPHNVYTSSELMHEAWLQQGASSSQARIAWHFKDAASSTDRGDGNRISVPYGGSYSVIWTYDKERNVYARSLLGRPQADQDGTAYEADNVLVMKTDQKILDGIGRLEVRTSGSGDAIGYRDGNKYILRWRRSPGEPIRFEAADGSEFLFVRGKTWIEVTTDDRIFGGI